MPAVRTLPTSDISSSSAGCALCLLLVRMAWPSHWTERLVGFLAPQPLLPSGAVVIQQGALRSTELGPALSSS